jgi:signal peptidase II
MSRASRWVLLLVALFGLVGCDHATKLAAKSQLEAAPPAQLIESVLALTYVENRDVAFNLLRWIPTHVRAPLLLVNGAVAIVALSVLFRRWRVRGAARVGLLLILAGAIGNYLDRVLRGYVVDFIHVRYWPVFNVADVLLTLGMGLLLLQAFRQRAELSDPSSLPKS